MLHLMDQCLTYCVAYNLGNLYLRQLYHLDASISLRNSMPYSYWGVYLSLVTLKGNRFYCCICLRREIIPRNKNLKLPPRRQLEPALKTNAVKLMSL